MFERPPNSQYKAFAGEHAIAALYNIVPSLDSLHDRSSSPSSHSMSKVIRLPKTSSVRLSESLLSQTSPVLSSEKTILYLAYGSNLSAETFKGSRGIRPLSAINVHVPSLDLTFDLPGIPYSEPCFANTRYRTLPASASPYDYHKDRWHKGLIGVVYEVTPDDYRTIIATEGGGASYQDVTVPCYALPSGSKSVNPSPSGAPFKAHTLLSPSNGGVGGRTPRPDPSYAQASVRYLKLITDGAEEHRLPDEYLAYLYNLRPYTISTMRQRAGQALFLAIWLPIITVMFRLAKIVAGKDGRVPAWMARLIGFVFTALWGSYDVGFKPVFGDGERTLEDKEDDVEKAVGVIWGEKSVRLDTARHLHD